MEVIMEVLEKFQAFIWGPPTLLLLLGTGIYFTVTLKGIQLFRFPKALKAIFEKEEGAGDVSAFATLCTTLAADIGTGSIVGVATALRIGGPGAMFWMWVSAFFGMTTKYAESVLAVKYRTKDENGQMAGGPMYYIQNGMGKKYIWLAKLFAIFGVFTALLGCGTFPPVSYTHLEENAQIKAGEISKIALAMPEYKDAIVLADDSGLEIDYLGGEPGIYSARYLGEDTSYDIKNQVILDRLAGVPDEERTARFVCAIAAALPDGRKEVVRGTMEGIIGHEDVYKRQRC